MRAGARHAVWAGSRSREQRAYPRQRLIDVRLGHVEVGDGAEAAQEPTTCTVDSDARLSIATGNTTGVYYSLGGAYAEVIGKASGGRLKATAAETSASLQNIQQLVAGTHQIAFSLADTAADAVEKAALTYPNASKHTDFRKLFDKARQTVQKQIGRNVNDRELLSYLLYPRVFPELAAHLLRLAHGEWLFGALSPWRSLLVSEPYSERLADSGLLQTISKALRPNTHYIEFSSRWE
jgi:hypothetical protein